MLFGKVALYFFTAAIPVTYCLVSSVMTCLARRRSRPECGAEETLNNKEVSDAKVGSIANPSRHQTLVQCSRQDHALWEVSFNLGKPTYLQTRESNCLEATDPLVCTVGSCQSVNQGLDTPVGQIVQVLLYSFH